MKSLKEKSGKGYSFGLDTNILMHYPSETFDILRRDTILISRHVQQELDGLKNSMDKQVATNARRAFKVLEEAQTRGQVVHILPAINPSVTTHLGLSDTMDDHIIASYIQASQTASNVFYFVSNDNGAKITARNAGLNVLDIRESRKDSRRNYKKLRLIFGLAAIIVFGFIFYNILSQRSTVLETHKKITDQYTASTNKMKNAIDQSNYEQIVESATKKPNHVYFPANADEFLEPSLAGDTILLSMKSLSRLDREKETIKLREILTPLAAKYYPSIKIDELSDEEVQSTFLFGKTDLRFGLHLLNWYEEGDDIDLIETLAFDSSDFGIHLFESSKNLDAVKNDIIDIMIDGPFKMN